MSYIVSTATQSRQKVAARTPWFVSPEYFIDDNPWSQWQSNWQQFDLIILEPMTGIASSDLYPEEPII